ncbi:Alpha/beta-hydrolase [Pleurostoma richardsiae]|uniref:Alpha/beta-hydrolase n=1 Tax=Pleurostoma richardsiae TaxID=41990 RepID=A0AA38RCH5_9PEZI|nr:Alpha/beta-hydrolase [Pleurostoma richardsiae]
MPTTRTATVPTVSAKRTIIHPNGQTTALFYDSFADPWKNNETILIQHGFARNASHFYHWVPALSRQYNVIRRDLRGHGGSSYPQPGDESYSYSTVTILDEIKDTLDQLGVERVHFLGESTSGMLAIAFAATYPDRIGSVILCSSPTYLPPASQKFLAFGEESWPIACRKLGTRGWVERLAASPGTNGSTDLDYTKWWMDEVCASDGEGLAGYADFLSKLDARPYLSQVRAPMLILAPTNSAVVTVDSANELAAQVPTARVAVIEANGHEIYSEAAEKCQAAVLQFLDGLSGT